MQIVIDIPQKLYKELMTVTVTHAGEVFAQKLIRYIKNGRPLPKGHGRLIDADALNIRMEQRMDEIGDDESIWESSNVATALDMFAPTILEADKAESRVDNGNDD